MPLDPTAISHLLSALSDAPQHVAHGAESRLGRIATDSFFRLLPRVYSHIKGGGKSDELSSEHGRLTTLLEALVAELEQHGITARFESEAGEPSTASFATAAIEDAIASPSADKRALLGRMIARRLSCETESIYELYLRDARRITSGLNDRQLDVLAALTLTSATPVPSSTPPDNNEYARTIESLYGAALDGFADSTWTRSDIEHLLTAEAIMELGDDDVSESPSYEQWPRVPLLMNRVRPSDGTDPWHPIRSRIYGLFTVQRGFQRGAQTSRSAISNLWLRPAGAVIGAMVLEGKVQRRIMFPEWEGLASEEIPSDALVAPFSSDYLEKEARDQQTMRRRSLKRTLEKLAPEIVNENMRQQMRSRPGGY
jgi:hypothetical protein